MAKTPAENFSDTATNGDDNQVSTNPFTDWMRRSGQLVYIKVLHPIKAFIEKIINARKARKAVAKGLMLAKAKLYKRAAVEFQNAMVLNEDVAEKMLDEEFTGMDLQSDAEALLSIGLVLLQKRQDDYALSNTLGNYARKMGDYKQANDLYRKALRIKKSYAKAFYNLAASMGKVDKYDFDVKQAIEKYIKSDTFIIPEYQNNAEVITLITQELRDKKKAEKEARIKKLLEEKEKAEAAKDKYEGKRIAAAIEILEKQPIEPGYDEICTGLQAIIDKSMMNQSTPEEVLVHHGNLFNLGLYAYCENDPDKALECFQDLKSKKCRIEHVDMMIALVTHLKFNEKEAIRLMFDLLAKDRFNRYLNVNLGLLYKKAGNRLQAAKYLAIGASLLERSEGLYRIPDMIRRAEEKYAEGKLAKALILFHIVATETDSIAAWLRIGSIYREMEKPSEAVKAYQEILRFAPDSEAAKEKLLELHDMYCERAEEVFQNRRFSQAAALYERALGATRLPKTIERAAAVYRQLNKNDRADELTEELDQLNEQEREAEREKLRQEYIAKGEMYLKRKAYEMAIASFEKAFRMKVDKEVFLALAQIYQGMKRTQDLSSLTHRWAKMNRYEEELKRKQKEKERLAATVGDEE